MLGARSIVPRIEIKEIDHHGLVLLTYTTHAVEAGDFLTTDLASDDEGKSERNLAKISYSHSDQREAFILFVRATNLFISKTTQHGAAAGSIVFSLRQFQSRRREAVALPPLAFP